MSSNNLISLLFFILLSLEAYTGRVEGRWMISEKEDLEFEKQLKTLNKPPLKTFKSQSGKIYDCVDIYKQSAFDNPLLKDHKLQIRPSCFPEGMPIEPAESNFDQRNNTCPQGTILARRVHKNDLIYAKHMNHIFKRHVARTTQPQAGPAPGTHYAVLKSKFGEYYGSHAKITVYGVRNIGLDQATVSQIWVIGGAKNDESNVNTVQAGWHVDPTVNGDSATYLATFWTADGYKSGCWNLNCQGFITMSRDLAPGAEITKLSTYGGDQVLIDIVIFKDKETGNWWLNYEGKLVGYWPKELFKNLNAADEIDWGGGVSSPTNKPSPPMCSGHFPIEGPKKTCYFTNIELVNVVNKYYEPRYDGATPVSDISRYYDIGANYPSGGSDGYLFSYGGPGGYTG